MTDRTHIGYTTPASEAVVDAWRVRLFCQAIGEDDPVYTDREAARRAGHPACPVPPTFLKALEGEHFSSARLMALLDVPLRQVLHAEQAFEHLAPLHVGDTVTISRRVADIYDKKDGAMTFIVVDTTYCVAGRRVATSRQTILVRNRPEAA